jgi:hypothetical protein
MSAERTETSPSEVRPSDSTHEKGGSLWILWAVIGVLLAYPLSFGPVARFYRGRGPAPPAARAFYAPIEIAYNRSDTVRKAIDWYLGRWGAHM